MRGRQGAVIFLGICLVIGSAILGASFFFGRQQTKTIRVVGAATKRFGSDIIKWRVGIQQATSVAGLKEGYAKIKKDLDGFTAMLIEAGVPNDGITIHPISVNQTYNNDGYVSGYNVSQNVYLVSKEVDRVEKIALTPNLLIDKNIYLQSSYLEYYSSELSEIKKELLAKATVDAKKRAEKIAESSGNMVGDIASARVGVFQITEPYSTEVSDYGIYNTSTKEKDITVTMNIEFYIK